MKTNIDEVVKRQLPLVPIDQMESDAARVLHRLRSMADEAGDRAEDERITDLSPCRCRDGDESPSPLPRQRCWWLRSRRQFSGDRRVDLQSSRAWMARCIRLSKERPSHSSGQGARERPDGANKRRRGRDVRPGGRNACRDALAVRALAGTQGRRRADSPAHRQHHRERGEAAQRSSVRADERHDGVGLSGRFFS